MFLLNIETNLHRSSFMGPLQNFWWLQTRKISESQASMQKCVAWTLTKPRGLGQFHSHALIEGLLRHCIFKCFVYSHFSYFRGGRGRVGSGSALVPPPLFQNSWMIRPLVSFVLKSAIHGRTGPSVHSHSTFTSVVRTSWILRRPKL